MNNFSDELSWSLSASNTSSAIHLLHHVWPSASWVTTCSVTDQAGVDLMGYRDGLSPIRVDVKFRRVPEARLRFFDPEDPDALFDVEYRSSDGQRRPGPVKLYGGPRTAPPADYYVHIYPDEQPPVGLLVDARASHLWLANGYEALRLLHSTTAHERLIWTTSFVATPGSLLNARAGRDTARLLTLNTSGSVVVSLP